MLRALGYAALVLVGIVCGTDARSQTATFVAFLDCTPDRWNYTDQSWVNVPWYFVTQQRPLGRMSEFSYVGDNWGDIEKKDAFLVWSENFSQPPFQGGPTTCARTDTIPWVYSVATQPLTENLDHKRAVYFFGIVFLCALGALYLFGLPLVWYGTSAGDSERWQRVKSIKTYAALSVGAVLVLIITLSNEVYGPLKRQEVAQSYYAFYSGMPKSAGGLPLRVSGNVERYLMFGPRFNADYTQGVGVFFELSGIITGIIVFMFGQRMLRGFYWIFVKHPATDIVGSAVGGETRIDGQSLSRSLWVSPRELFAWRPRWYWEQQAQKARALTEKLDRDTELARAAIARERARAELHETKRPSAEEMRERVWRGRTLS